MPLVNFKTPAAAISGKLGNAESAIVYYLQDGRGIVRQFTYPLQPDTSDQQLIRSVFTALIQSYQTLSQTQLDAWTAFAQKIKRRDRLGRAYTLSSLQAYQQINSHRVLAGESALADPPTYITTPAPLSVTSIFNDTTADEFQITLTHLNPPASGNWRIRLTPPLGSLVRKAQQGELRSATIAFADSYFAITASPQTIIIPFAQLRFQYTAAQTLGSEILALSPAYVPGLTLFLRRIVIT